MITAINPATGETVGAYSFHDDTQVDQILDAAAKAQRQWRLTDVGTRTELLRNIAVVLRDGREKYAGLITAEMGKPITEARAEIDKCAKTLDYYSDHAAGFLADEEIASDASWSGVAYEPLGTVLAIMPWNYPFWQFFRFVAPALAAGNAALLKHANNVPGCAIECERILAAARAPEGLFATLLIPSSKVKDIIEDDRVAAVTLTGSTEVGAIVASQAGGVLKKQVLELGGSDPFIVLADADVDLAAREAVRARFINNGQSCVNAKRFIVDESVADRFVELFRENVQALVQGDPEDPSTQLGPMARENLRTDIHDQVRRSIEEGAELMLGGDIVDGPGYYYQPTILDRVTPSQTAFREETFGPVAAIIRVSNADEAVELANDTEFGLAGSVWSSDSEKALAIGRRLDAGAIFINSIVASDPRLPFGGIKRSGYGRELSVNGLREFINVKTISIA